jgi:ketosteroid isomerase-like protein
VKNVKIVAAVLLIAVAAPALSQESNKGIGFDQQRFAEAYNRKDADAMAMAFSADAIRVRPSGIFHGRDEIRQGFQDALNLGLHDYAVKQTDSRNYGDLVLNVGDWQAKLGDQLFHGHYTSILGREGDQIKILEETVTVSVSGK